VITGRPLACVAALAITVASGCSASHRIAQKASSIRESADAIIDAADRMDAASPDVQLVRAEAEQIRHQVTDIHATLPGVRDVVPAWITMLTWLAVAAAGACLVWLLTTSGVLSAIRVALGWLPRRTQRAAALLRDAVDESKPETVREAIAAMRAQDAEFDAAYKRTKTRADNPIA
jgi:hypothetical protein